MIKGSTNAIDYREHVLDKEARRVIQVDPFGGVLTEGNFDIIVEEVGNTTYVGKTQLGGTTGASVWQIMRIVESSGTTTIRFADATDAFTKVWDDRTTYVY